MELKIDEIKCYDKEPLLIATCDQIIINRDHPQAEVVKDFLACYLRLPAAARKAFRDREKNETIRSLMEFVEKMFH